MDYAVAVREAAFDAVADITPEGFRDDIEAFVAGGSLVPGVLTLLAAESAGGDPGELTEHAVGVQLIYDGLRLTRRLATEDPWAGDVSTANGAERASSEERSSSDRSSGHDPREDGEAASRNASERDRANVDILAADVLVSRGFFLLARTDAAEDAVEVVRAFGRDQTGRAEAADPEAVDTELEIDVLRLAMVAGTAAAGETPGETDALVREFVSTYDGGFPAPATLFDDGARTRIAAASGGTPPLNRND